MAFKTSAVIFSITEKNLQFEIHQNITISVEEALTFNQDWMPTDMSFYLPPKSGFQCLLVILEILECDMTIDHHFGGVANEQRDDKNQSNQNQFDTPLLPRQAAMSGFGLTIK